MTKHQKGGGDALTTLFASGLGAYAAKNSGSMRSLLWTLFKYGAVIVVLSFVVFFLASIFLGREGFWMPPLKPSPGGDEKMVTPAGNVIAY
jgi:hypothetical protein